MPHESTASDETLYPSVSEQEYARRHGAVWQEMDARGLNALVVYSGSSASSDAANGVYLTGYRDPLFSYAVVPSGGEPRLLIGNPLYLPTAYAMARVRSIDHVTWDPGTRIAEVLREVGAASGRVGLVGAAGIQKVTLPHEHLRALTSALPGAHFEDATDLLKGLRRVKSAEEIACLRKGAEMTDATVAALQAEARAGMSDGEWAGIIAHTAFSLGGDQRTLFIGSTSMAEPEIVFPRQEPAQRTIGPNDIVLTELSTSYAGYAGQIHRAFVVGDEPTPAYQRVFEVAKETCERVLAAMGPGATDEDVRRAARPALQDAGMWTMDTLLHGWGLSLEPPRLDVPEVATIARPQEPTTFEPGMTVVLQPHVLSPDRQRGLQLGSLVVITEDGAEALQQYSMEFIRIAA